MTTELKPCPFCGADGGIIESDGTFYAACSSLDCFCAVGEVFDGSSMPEHVFLSEIAAITAWNTRKATP